MPTPQNGQTHSRNSLAKQKPTNCLSVFDHFVWLALKGLAHAFTTGSIFLRWGMFRFDKDIANVTSVDVFIANFK